MVMASDARYPAAFVFCSPSPSKAVLRQYRKISSSAKGLGDAWLLLQMEDSHCPRGLDTSKLHVVSNAEIRAMGYPMQGPTVIPGHVHFPILHFFQKHPDYPYYWLIEYDVRFTGNWRVLFSAFERIEADFIAAHIYTHADEPRWNRWELLHPRQEIEIEKRLRCFHPICRFSKPALEYICTAHEDGWHGHSEVLLPSLLDKNGFSIVDFGGSGNFVPPGMKSRFYIDSLPDEKGLLDTGTLRYRPAFVWPGLRRNRLYHPVKPILFVWKEQIRSFLKFLLGKSLAARLIRSMKSLFRDRAST